MRGNELLRYPWIRKFGFNGQVDLNSDPEDVWTAGALYGWPAAEAATTILSTSTDDDGDPAGTGAQTVYVEGCDDEYNMLTQLVTMNGTGAVTLDDEYYRVWRAYVVAVGSGMVNAGIIRVKHGATVLSQIEVGLGQTEQCIYTVPVQTDSRGGTSYLTGVGMWPYKPQAAHLDMNIFTRKPGESWRGRLPTGIHSNSAGTYHDLYGQGVPIQLVVGEDVRLTLVETSANTVGASGGFNIHWIR